MWRNIRNLLSNVLTNLAVNGGESTNIHKLVNDILD
jgi:glutamine amidotransferase PdxT